MLNIGERLKTLRLENKLTQTQLAKALNIGQTTVAAYENGAHLPNIYALVAYADYFQCSLDYLIGRENETGKIVINSEIKLDGDELRLLGIYKTLIPKLKTLLIQNAELLKHSELNDD